MPSRTVRAAGLAAQTVNCPTLICIGVLRVLIIVDCSNPQ